MKKIIFSLLFLSYINISFGNLTISDDSMMRQESFLNDIEHEIEKENAKIGDIKNFSKSDIQCLDKIKSARDILKRIKAEKKRKTKKKKDKNSALMELARNFNEQKAKIQRSYLCSLLNKNNFAPQDVPLEKNRKTKQITSVNCIKQMKIFKNDELSEKLELVEVTGGNLPQKLNSTKEQNPFDTEGVQGNGR